MSISSSLSPSLAILSLANRTTNGDSSLCVPVRVRSVLTPKNPSTDRASIATSSSGPKWAQKIITLPPLKRGCHLITPKIMKEIRKDLSDFNVALLMSSFFWILDLKTCLIFAVQHTSASLTINENYDPDVQDDTETFLNRIVPEV
ncbi:unnamed protein product [Arabis nemorensis]|uniref:Uncharacterized protein n=1 Tax=Arabis nemorensis TaxID=586526 RepID=A0A565CJJ5_9BRAS|nr:unnamed protein product [Arabis nemorensis]